MNTADFFALLTLLLCSIFAPLAAGSVGAPIWVVAICLLLGVAIGFAGAHLIRWIAYRPLSGESRFFEFISCIASMILPLLGMFLFIFIAILSSLAISKLFGFEAL